MNSEETLQKNDDTTNLILDAISTLRGEMNQQIGDLRREMNQQIGDLRREMNERFAKVESEIVEIKDSVFSLDVRLERVQAMAHDALNIGHDLKADVKILTAEVRAWAADVVELQQKI